MTLDIDDKIEAALAALHARTPRVNVRRLARSTYSEDLNKIIAKADACQIFLHMEAHGGFVTNNYPGQAAADYLTVDIDLRTEAATIRAFRANAKRSAHGAGSTVKYHLKSLGQARGHVVVP